MISRVMRRLADDLYILRGSSPYAINVHLMRDVLVDADSRHARNRILGELKGRTVAALRSPMRTPTIRGESRGVRGARDSPVVW